MLTMFLPVDQIIYNNYLIYHIVSHYNDNPRGLDRLPPFNKKNFIRIIEIKIAVKSDT
jgi:hypothetical protein